MSMYRGSSIQERFPVGCRIRLIDMPNDPNPIPSDMTGTVVWPDPMPIMATLTILTKLLGRMNNASCTTVANMSFVIIEL